MFSQTYQTDMPHINCTAVVMVSPYFHAQIRVCCFRQNITYSRYSRYYSTSNITYSRYSRCQFLLQSPTPLTSLLIHDTDHS